MWWLMACVAVSAAGLIVLGVLAVRVFLAGQDLARQVGVSAQALADAVERLQRDAEPVAERAGEISRR